MHTALGDVQHECTWAPVHICIYYMYRVIHSTEAYACIESGTFVYAAHCAWCGVCVYISSIQMMLYIFIALCIWAEGKVRLWGVEYRVQGGTGASYSCRHRQKCAHDGVNAVSIAQGVLTRVIIRHVDVIRADWSGS